MISLAANLTIANTRCDNILRFPFQHVFRLITASEGLKSWLSRTLLMLLACTPSIKPIVKHCSASCTSSRRATFFSFFTRIFWSEPENRNSFPSRISNYAAQTVHRYLIMSEKSPCLWSPGSLSLLKFLARKISYSPLFISVPNFPFKMWFSSSLIQFELVIKFAFGGSFLSWQSAGDIHVWVKKFQIGGFASAQSSSAHITDDRITKGDISIVTEGWYFQVCQMECFNLSKPADLFPLFQLLSFLLVNWNRLKVYLLHEWPYRWFSWKPYTESSLIEVSNPTQLRFCVWILYQISREKNKTATKAR